MVKKLKKINLRIAAIGLALIMALSLIPISQFVFAETTNHPDAITITVLDGKGDVLNTAKVSYSVYSVSKEENVVANEEVAVDEDGVVEVMSFSQFDEYAENDLKLTATASAEGYTEINNGASITESVLIYGNLAYELNLFEEIKEEDIIKKVGSNLTYDAQPKDLLTVSVLKDDKVTISVDDVTYDGYDGTKQLAENKEITVSKTDADNYAIAISVEREGYAEFEYSNTVGIGKYQYDEPIELDMPKDVVYNIDNTIPCACKDFVGKENAEITYSIEEGTDKIDNQPIASIKANQTGGYYIEYTNVGKIVVKATVAERNNYFATSNTKEITVKYADFDGEIPVKAKNPETAYMVSNEKLWVDGGGVTLSVDGWSILDSDNQWKDEIVITDEGDYSDLSYKLKNAKGEITDFVDVPTFAIDITPPKLSDTDKDNSKFGVEFKNNNDDLFSKVFHALTFGLFFNDDITVTVNCDDNQGGAGIKSIQLYEKSEKSEKSDDSSEWEEVTPNKETKNVFTISPSFKGTLKVIITDNVGNPFETQIKSSNSNMESVVGFIMLEQNPPTVPDLVVETSVNKYSVNDETPYYAGDVLIKTSAEDTESGLYSVKVYSSLTTTEEDPVYDSTYFSEAQKTDKFDVEIDTSTVDPNDQGELSFTVVATDNAGNETKKSITIKKDTTAPIIEGFDFTPAGNMDYNKVGAIYEAVTSENYGFFFKDDVTVTITAKDIPYINNDEKKYEAASGVKSITYYTKDITTGETQPTTVDVDENNEISFELKEGFKGQIFAFATDNLENTVGTGGYVHPYASVLESSVRHKDTSAIDIVAPVTSFTQNNILNEFTDYNFANIEPDKELQQAEDVDTKNVPLYSKNSANYSNESQGFNFDVTVKDTFSGIQSVEYAVLKKGNGNLIKAEIKNDGTFNGNANGWTIVSEANDYNLVTEMKNTITVSETENANDITLLVILTDRSGNKSYDYYTFGIDITNPVINVTYSDDEIHDDTYKDYFRTNRNVTITVTERNFRAEDIDFAFTNTDGWVPNIDLKSSAVWETVEDAENPDNTKHIAKFSYSHDGDYTFSIDYMDNAKNKAEGYGEKFTIDKTIPSVTVTYDNNSAQNGNYYKDARIATITINEHNFDARRVKIIGTASETAFPKLSAWKSKGNIHTATISYAADSLYTFDIEFVDMAGNSIKDFVPQEFTVDKTNPALEITGIVDKSANSNKGNIGFIIKATDTNFDVFEPVITAVRYTDNRFETTRINVGTMSSISNGSQYVVTNIDTDGIYKVTCTVVDKAGNAFSEVALQDANGVMHSEKRSGNDVLLTFSVNRNGSTFYVDGYTGKVLKNYYVKNVKENIQINEINADTIVEKTISINGKELAEGTDYTSSYDKGDGTWYRYTYNIKKSVFENEGEYNIVVHTKDRANNQAYSDIKNLSVKFVVDRTAPIVTLSGLKTDGRYRTDKQIVKVIPSDDGGLLSKLIIRTVDENGKVLKELINLEGDELLDVISKGDLSFELGEGLYQNIQIICEDAAGNVIGENASGELYENVSVSTNAFLIFWANKIARIAAIAGLSVIIVGAGVLVFLKKKKSS